MNENTNTGKATKDGLRATYSAREIFACIPEWHEWRLLRKVPYTKQTYEVAGSPGSFYLMDDLVAYAAENKQYKPVIRPTFCATKYLTSNGRQIIYQDNG